MMRSLSIRLAVATLFALITGPAHADFPPITDAQKALTAFPGHPNAPAVVLDHEGDLILRDPNVNRIVTILNVRKRIKILNQEGVDQYGEIVLGHSRYQRMSNFQGRTVLPDGTAIPVTEDAIFERRSSRSERIFETAVAFPSVVPGAILDYSYEIRRNSMIYGRPWYFQDVIPTVRSQITYHPSDYHVLASWGLSLPGKNFQTETNEEKDGRAIRVWLENLPPIPDEPSGLPLSDLSARILMYVETHGQGQYPIMQTWRSIVDIVEESTYKPMLKNDGRVQAKARELTAGAGDDRAKAQALYRFVRDEIALIPISTVLWGDENRGVDGILADGRGAPIEQALLLHSLLDNAKIDSELVWVADSNSGRIDPAVPNPWWFDRGLVRVRLGGDTVFLDPSDDSLPFGALRPFNEGQPALLYKKKPEMIEIPAGSWDGNGRRAEIAWAVAEDGRLTGTGELTWTGHEAWAVLKPGAADAAVQEGWSKFLDERFPGFAVGDVAVTQDVAEQQVTVGFSLAQNEEDVLGDEVTVIPSRPLGPLAQAFELPPSRRLTPVRLPFGSWDEVVTEVTWPEGWSVEQEPTQIDDRNPVGVVELRIEKQPDERKLTIRRRFEIHKRDFPDGRHYDNLRMLYGTVSEHDAQPLVLVRGAG